MAFVIFCRWYVSHMSFFVDLMSIFVDLMSLTCVEHEIDKLSIFYQLMSIFVRFFFGRHQNDINFDVDFMSTTHNFFFWKFFSFLTHVDKVWTLRKIYIFTMKSKRYWFSSHNIRKDTIGKTQSLNSNKTR